MKIAGKRNFFLPLFRAAAIFSLSYLAGLGYELGLGLSTVLGSVYHNSFPDPKPYP